MKDDIIKRIRNLYKLEKENKPKIKGAMDDMIKNIRNLFKLDKNKLNFHILFHVKFAAGCSLVDERFTPNCFHLEFVTTVFAIFNMVRIKYIFATGR